MKTKFSISEEIFLRDMSLSESYEFYEKNYKQLGWQINKEKEDVFMIIDKEINLQEGDRVDVDNNNFRIVNWKCVDVFNDRIEYALEIE
jgi:hypothetical protein